MAWDDREVTTKNGTEKRISAKNIQLKEQNVMVSTVHDVTEQKRTEEALRENQKLLHEAHALAHIGVWTWEKATDTVKWTEELFCIAGRDHNLPAPTYKEHPKLYTTESFERLDGAAQTGTSKRNKISLGA